MKGQKKDFNIYIGQDWMILEVGASAQGAGDGSLSMIRRVSSWIMKSLLEVIRRIVTKDDVFFQMSPFHITHLKATIQ
jgi:hypothetical protein